jgi:hypothetical protein
MTATEGSPSGVTMPDGYVLDFPSLDRGSHTCTLCGVSILATGDIGAAAPTRPPGGVYLACETCADQPGVKAAFRRLDAPPYDPDAQRSAALDPTSIDEGWMQDHGT